MKTTKHLILLLALTVLAAALLCVCAGAEYSPPYTYSVSNGKATVTDCNISVSGALTIPDTLGGYPVTSIGNYAFDGCKSLTSVTIPDSVTSNGSRAFSSSTSLTSIHVSAGNANYCSVDGVLYNKAQTALICYPAGKTAASFTVPDSVTAIGNAAFDSCTSLTSVTIPDSVTSIGSSAFYKCSSLISVTIGNGVTSIGVSAFYKCSSLTGLTIGNGVTSIGGSAFSDCSSLTNVTIPDSVTYIGDYAFDGCESLTSVTIPDSVTSIGSYAFYNTPYYKDSSNWENGVLYNGKYLIEANDTLSGSYLIKEGTKCIAVGAFHDCDKLTGVTIPESVTFIGNSAFYNCSSLTGINVAAGNADYCSMDDALYNKDKTTLICYPAKKVAASFIIPESVTSIGDRAFYKCKSLTDMTIGNGVVSIGHEAFRYCTSLTTVTIGDGVTFIGYGAFYDTACYNDSSNWENDVLYIGKYLIEAGYTLPDFYTIKDGTKCIAYSAFFRRASLISVTIPDSVTAIGDKAFFCCTSLTSVTIPDSVTSIGNGAFVDTACYDDNSNWENDVLYIGKCLIGAKNSLSGSYSIKEETTCIADRAFYNCSSLTSVTIPNSVKAIGVDAFDGCIALTDINYGGTKAQWNRIEIADDIADVNDVPTDIVVHPAKWRFPVIIIVIGVAGISLLIYCVIKAKKNKAEEGSAG